MERMVFREPEPKWEREEQPERAKNPERARLIETMMQIIGGPAGGHGTPPTTTSERVRQLEALLEAEPQRDSAGMLRYLLTSGLAVELITGFERFHHDIDLVIMEPSKRRKWDLIGTDNVTPGRYWADMQFEPPFMEDTARTVATRRKGKPPVVEVVHPGIILVQKSSDAFGRPPRQRDRDDVGAIVRHWVDKEGYTHEWNPIIRHSIDALPPHQVQTTLGRVRQALK
jgi:hypothetical protein